LLPLASAPRLMVVAFGFGSPFKMFLACRP